jgi:exonuclease V gamma subunit
MSTLYLGTSLDALAARFATLLDQSARAGDFFAPATVIVPNRYVGKWLRLWLARRDGIAINLHFGYLETHIWELLKQVDGRRHEQRLELLDDTNYRLMILSVLLDEREGAPEGLRDYLHTEGNLRGRDFCRRSWQLADRLAGLIRDYEYHRQDQLIQRWLCETGKGPNALFENSDLEVCQRELFRKIVREPDGVRALLSRAAGKTFKTLPQYAMEVMTLPPSQLQAPPESPTIHLFGLAQISALHTRVLRWLGQRYDLRLYYISPLVGRLGPLPGSKHQARSVLQALAQDWRGAHAQDGVAKDELVSAWGRAGAESLWLMGDLLAGPRSFRVEAIEAPPAIRPPSVLSRLQARLLARSPVAASPIRARNDPSPLFAEPGGRGQPQHERGQPLVPSSPACVGRGQGEGGQGQVLAAAAATPTPFCDPPLRQDASLQIVACPGIWREVETVHNSILHNLHQQPDLKQTDIAVLVTDMARYRPVIRAVFDRRPQHLLYNLTDFSAAGVSVFGDALLGLLDLALESFGRCRVFGVILNPCFLARLGVDREQALTWLGWAESLGIYHSWDSADKRERGYADTALYSWRHGLQRLRLGRIMEITNDEADLPAVRYRDVIPFADLATTDKELLDGFCRAVEGVLPRLAKLREFHADGKTWARELRELVHAFLAVPSDRPEEEEVRDRLFQALERLPLLDRVRAPQGVEPRLPLAVVREFVADSLERIAGTRGEYLTGGVTIAAMQPLRPVPFRIIYLLGLGEGLFPGSNRLSTLDLRSRERCRGDILPAESNRFLLMEMLLAAQDKVYLFYTNRDLQRDQELQPCSSISQLRRYLEHHVVEGKFTITEVPLRGSEFECLELAAEKGAPDVLANYSEAERLVAIEEGRQENRLELDENCSKEIDRRLDEAQPAFRLPAGQTPGRAGIQTITLKELKGFLRCPAEAAVRRHLGLRDDEELEPQEDEPFYTAFPLDYRLQSAALARFVACGVHESVDRALESWPHQFESLYDDWRLRGRLPDGPYAEVDRGRLESILRPRIVDDLGEFLRHRETAAFCGPVLVGESTTPVGARQRFPALKLALGSVEARLVGAQHYAWRSQDSLDFLTITNSAGKKVPRDALSVPLVESLLFYLVLLLGDEPGSDRVASRDWVSERKVEFHIAHQDGMASFVCHPGAATPKEARAYLAMLLSEFLDRTSFDLIPFDLMVTNEALRAPYAQTPDAAIAELLPADANKALASVLAENAAASSFGENVWSEVSDRDVIVRAASTGRCQEYARALEEAIAHDLEKERPEYRPMKLMELVEAKVPADAWDKVRRRFQFLHRLVGLEDKQEGTK